MKEDVREKELEKRHTHRLICMYDRSIRDKEKVIETERDKEIRYKIKLYIFCLKRTCQMKVCSICLSLVNDYYLLELNHFVTTFNQANITTINDAINYLKK